MTQLDLFDKPEKIQNEQKVGENVVAKVTTTKAPLTKVQKQFNRLSTRISNLKKEIKTTEETLIALKNLHDKEVRPEIVQLGKEKIRLSHLLHQKRNDIKLSNAANEDLDALILDMLDDAFYVVAPNEDDQNLFTHYSEISYGEAADQEHNDVAEMFSEMLYEQMGLKIDPAEFTKENPDFEKLKEQLEEQINEQQAAADLKSKKRKKSARTLEKEKREEQKEALKKKSLRNVYVALVKILHPDKELDESLKLEKEEYMKRVTGAYEAKNLTELLELEMIWVNKYENQLNQTPEDVLQLYIELLKEQEADLKEEMYMVRANPIYNNVIGFANYPKSHVKNKLKSEQEAYRIAHRSYTTYIRNLEKGNRDRANIMECIERFGFKQTPPHGFPIFFS